MQKQKQKTISISHKSYKLSEGTDTTNDYHRDKNAKIFETIDSN